MIAKRLRNMLLLALGAGLVWAVAPALSTSPYLPTAEDFTQPLPQAHRLDAAGTQAGRARVARAAERGDVYGAHGPLRYRTPPIEAPHRFDLVGVAGEMRALEFRARESGEAWSDWVETDNGDPVYTGGADEVQVRSRGVPIEGELHYVNVSGTVTTAGRILNGLRSSVSSAVVALAATPVADAASPRPNFISRKEWGANRKRGGCKPRDKPSKGKIKAGIVHHTVSTNTYSRSQAAGVVLGICRYHRNGNGWDDIGYNALVDRFGNLYQGRAGGMRKPIIGAQAEGVNSQTTGIAAIGDYQRERLRPKARRQVVRYLAWKMSISHRKVRGRVRLRSTGGASSIADRGKIIKTKPIIGHQDTNYTGCPGGRLYKQLRKIRRQVQRRVDRFKNDSGEEQGGDEGGGSQPRGGVTPG